ncbi:MAG: choice-of-anchor Q domain-containing protein [Dokdonella sp.]
MNHQAWLIALAALFSGSVLADNIIQVTTDSVEHVLPDECTVFAAFDAAQFNVATGGCPAGSATDTDVIVLPPGAVFDFTEHAENLSNEFEALRGIDGGGAISVQGNGAKFRRALTTSCAQVGITGRLSFLKVRAPDLRMTISELTFEEGCSSAVASAMEFRGSELTLDRVTFNRNHSFLGGALFLDMGSKVTIRDSYFSDNGIYPYNGLNPPVGGALRSSAQQLRIERSTFAYSEGQTGAALSLIEPVGDSSPIADRKVALINNTFDNSSLSPALLVTQTLGSVILVHNTFTSNSASMDGAVLRKSNPATKMYLQGNWFNHLGAGPVANCAGLDNAFDVFSSINMADDNTCPTFEVRTGGVRALGYYGGGFAPTRPPLPGNPVIDAAVVCDNIPEATPLSLDARLVPRPQYGGVQSGNCDLGAVEYVVNQAPSVLAPAAVNVPHDASIALGAAFGVGDADAYLGALTLTASVSHGSLQAPALTDVQCVSGGAALVTCSGSIDAVSAAFKLFVYTPALGFGGNDNLVLHLVDQGADDMHPYEDNRTVVLNVVGASAFLVLSATSINFGSTPVGTSTPFQPITITNAGGQSMNLASVGLAPQSSPYLVVDTCPTMLDPLESCTINIRFNPTVIGDTLAFVTFSGSASNSPLSAILIGQGVSADTIFENGFDQ